MAEILVWHKWAESLAHNSGFFIAFRLSLFSLTIACQDQISVLIFPCSKAYWHKPTFLLLVVFLFVLFFLPILNVLGKLSLLVNWENDLGIQVSARSSFPNSVIRSLYLQICVWISYSFWLPFHKYLGEIGEVDLYWYNTLCSYKSKLGVWI